MEYSMQNEEYYKKMIELQERLRKSEEERLKLEEKFNEIMQKTRDAEHDRLRLMRYKYHKFLEEDKIRQERNENILRALERVESRAKMLEAKTSRFKAFRKQCESYIKSVYRSKTEQQPPFQNTSPTQIDRTYTQSNVRKKLFPDLPSTNENIEGKVEMLEQYLRDNFENFPRDIKNINDTRVYSDENGHTANNLQNQEKNTFYNQNNYQKQQYLEPDSDSKESQEIFDDYKKYPTRSDYRQNIPYPKPPTKSELLGNTIEKELERLRHKDHVKQISFLDENKQQPEVKQPEKVIQNYKDLVSKSEEKYGLRGESPVRNKINIVDKEIEKHDFNPKIFDNKTNTLNIVELKNITKTPNIQKPANIEENVESESENIIKNYKNMVKSLKEELPPIETNNLNVPVILPVEKNNNVSEISKNDDNSERTEPPTDVSFNISSNKIDEFLPVEQVKLESNIRNDNIDSDLNQNVATNENSVNESTVKEQLHVNLEKEILMDLKPIDQYQESTDNHNIQEKNVFQDYAEEQIKEHISQSKDNYKPQVQEDLQVYQEQTYLPEAEEHQNVYQEQTYQPEEAENQLAYQEQNYQPEEEVNQEQIYRPETDGNQHTYQEQNYQPEQAVNQHVYQDQSYQPEVTYSEEYNTEQNIQQPEYQQDYDTSQQNIGEQPVYQQDYNIQQAVADSAVYEEGYDQNNVNQVEYLENNEITQQNMIEQQEYQEGYDMTQQDPNYQEGYDPQYYTQQDGTGQEYNPQYAEGQEMYPGYEQYPQEQYDQQQSDYAQEQVQQETYDTQMYPTEQNQYQEYDPSSQPQEYIQEYDQQYTQEGQVSESLYKSEQDYIKGEQNIDKQYENQECQEQNYPETYVQQDNSLQQEITTGNVVNKQEETNVNISESTEQSSSLHLNESVDNKPIVEKQLPNITDMLDTDTESQSIKQDTKVSNDSDFDFSKS